MKMKNFTQNQMTELKNFIRVEIENYYDETDEILRDKELVKSIKKSDEEIENNEVKAIGSFNDLLDELK